ncbi:MAG: hypothetical protein Q7T20_03340 [Saprospiraceae bacterium]|nr:hypothetical protein [Saprospiraceae bacterium]
MYFGAPFRECTLELHSGNVPWNSIPGMYPGTPFRECTPELCSGNVPWNSVPGMC